MTADFSYDRHVPLVSVIMPIYNADMYLRKAIESVRAQTLADLELILIDDGSTDGSGEICDEYAAVDSRIVVIHCKNAGTSASRNKGMDHARGKWLAFCDHDDNMMPDFLETLVNEGERTGSEIVKCNHKTFTRFRDGTIYLEFPGLEHTEGWWRADELLKMGNYAVFRRFATLVWDAVFLRKIIIDCGIRFDVLYKFGGEDIDFMLRLLAEVGGGVWIPQVLFHHYVNMGVSQTSKCHEELLDDCLHLALMESELYRISSARIRFHQFAEWTVGIIHYVFLAEGCRLSLRKKIVWLKRYYEELVGKEASMSLKGLPLKRVFLCLCVRWNLLGLYLILKKGLVFARHVLRERINER